MVKNALLFVMLFCGTLVGLCFCDRTTSLEDQVAQAWCSKASFCLDTGTADFIPSCIRSFKANLPTEVKERENGLQRVKEIASSITCKQLGDLVK